MPKGGDTCLGGMEISLHPVKLEDYDQFNGANKDFDLNLHFPRFHMSHLLSVTVREVIFPYKITITM